MLWKQYLAGELLCFLSPRTIHSHVPWSGHAQCHEVYPLWPLILTARTRVLQGTEWDNRGITVLLALMSETQGKVNQARVAMTAAGTGIIRAVTASGPPWWLLVCHLYTVSAKIWEFFFYSHVWNIVYPLWDAAKCRTGIDFYLCTYYYVLFILHLHVPYIQWCALKLYMELHISPDIPIMDLYRHNYAM